MYDEFYERKTKMDRRQQKTRAAIMQAFISLLTEKHYNKITVQNIIDKADVGRTTFYAHFETKDDLLKSLCEELFGHIIGSVADTTHTHGIYKDESFSVFCHLLHHLQENSNNVLELLSCESSEIFLRYFRKSMDELVRKQLESQKNVSDGKNGKIPREFLINHITGSFVEMVFWWIRGNMKETPEELDNYFRAVIEPVLSLWQ